MKKIQHASHSERAENDAGHKHKACKSDAHLFDENRQRECVCLRVYVWKYPCVGMYIYACAHAYMHRSMYVCVMYACMLVYLCMCV